MANIHTSRRSGFIQRSGRNRRESLWLFVTENAASLALATSAVISNSLNAAALALRPFTIVRSRIHLNIQSDQQAGSEDQVGAFGIAVVSDQAVAIGVTAVPTPVTDLGSDLWLAHQYMTASLALNSAVGFDAQFTTNFDLDSKAMRKVEEGQDIVFVKERGTLGDGITLFSAGRMLIKLH